MFWNWVHIKWEAWMNWGGTSPWFYPIWGLSVLVLLTLLVWGVRRHEPQLMTWHWPHMRFGAKHVR